MIRLRFDTGKRNLDRRAVVGNRFFAVDKWIRLAALCADLQSQAIVSTGRKIVCLESARLLDLSDSVFSLYQSGILELISWDENRSGQIMRIRSVDLSVEAAKSLCACGIFPRCFLLVLLANDLVDEVLRVECHQVDDTLVAEFDAWMKCGGFYLPGGNAQVDVRQAA